VYTCFNTTKAQENYYRFKTATIAEDLTNAFSSDAAGAIKEQNSELQIMMRPRVDPDDIQHVTVITWNNMYDTVTTKTL